MQPRSKSDSCFISAAKEDRVYVPENWEGLFTETSEYKLGHKIAQRNFVVFLQSFEDRRMVRLKKNGLRPV